MKFLCEGGRGIGEERRGEVGLWNRVCWVLVVGQLAWAPAQLSKYEDLQMSYTKVPVNSRPALLQ